MRETPETPSTLKLTPIGEVRSPLIDIKPYVDIYHGVDNPRFPEWILQIHRDLEGP